ncbi:hypothetical protein AN639_09045 [Candidatus Epulonipiscium fishelsonii]|uniref:Uncharacterized protein n=1 Tax=Candidatus Epulonipiscium fishelsonii TaxID=77094 RepID=A0ACC8XDM5_9FIRM|nr:hypothetical protein AN639_09045 [Epulopiscium sp. SCG-B05WGA-EpuloA1]ONI40992.1 hypothetical protein AN396_04330 [Epulopiscium sp. SCG-B11WGA-EpuloA1]
MSDGMLSQEEINALLGGIDLQEDTSANGGSTGGLTGEEVDVLGEIGNINMGTAATTLFMLLNHKVEITAPQVSFLTTAEFKETITPDLIAVSIDYVKGLLGTNLMILKADDVKAIADLMMGGTGAISNDAINEFHLSAISEAMNQMMGSSSTSMSQMFDKIIDISPPNAVELGAAVDKFDTLITQEEPIVKISFRMRILEDIIDTELMQVFPLSFAKSLVNNLLKKEPDVISSNTDSILSDAESLNNPTQDQNHAAPPPGYGAPPPGYGAPPPGYGAPPYGTPPGYIHTPQDMYSGPSVFSPNVEVKVPNFGSFDEQLTPMGRENIDLLMDVSLQVSVELGRTKRKIRDILEFTQGSVVELDKLVGEPIDLLVNGKFVASGEVVVIDENFGIRILSIIKPENRI